MATDIDDVIWARDHLLAGCISFSLFVFLAWLAAVFNEHHMVATLSEMVHDWNTAEGKIFIVALLLPAIFFLLSSYPYKLPNATVRGHRFGHVCIVVRHFFVNTGLVLVAFVPTIPLIQSSAHKVEALIHSFAAALCFGSFVLAECFVLLCSTTLGEVELRWRRAGLAFMLSCLALLGVHKTLFTFDIVGTYSQAWTFRYEMLLGGGLISQNQLLWYFSDPEVSREKDQGFLLMALIPAVFPYLGGLVIVVGDFWARQNTYALPLAVMEVLFILLVTALCHVGLSALRKLAVGAGEADGPGGEDGYGAVGGT